MTEERDKRDRVLDLRDHETSLAYLRAALVHQDSVTELRGLLADELAPANLHEWEDDEVLDTLAWRIARADLTPTRLRREYRSDEQIKTPERAGGEPVLAVSKETTWIEIQLVDEEGEPVSGARYELKMPDGSIKSGTLNYRGRVRVDGIEEPGNCGVKFPDLDAEAWERI